MPGAGVVRVGGWYPGGHRVSSLILFVLNGLWCERCMDLTSALQEVLENDLDLDSLFLDASQIEIGRHRVHQVPGPGPLRMRLLPELGGGDSPGRAAAGGSRQAETREACV